MFISLLFEKKLQIIKITDSFEIVQVRYLFDNKSYGSEFSTRGFQYAYLKRFGKDFRSLKQYTEGMIFESEYSKFDLFTKCKENQKQSK